MGGSWSRLARRVPEDTGSVGVEESPSPIMLFTRKARSVPWRCSDTSESPRTSPQTYRTSTHGACMRYLEATASTSRTHPPHCDTLYPAVPLTHTIQHPPCADTAVTVSHRREVGYTGTPVAPPRAHACLRAHRQPLLSCAVACASRVHACAVAQNTRVPNVPVLPW